MSTFKAVIEIDLENFDTEKETTEAINTIFNDGFDAFRKNYAEPLGRAATITNVATSLVVPSFGDIDQVTAAKLLTKHFTVQDRQVGAQKHRGSSGGAFFLVDKVITVVLKRLHVDHLFEMYVRSGSNLVLVQDILGNIVVNFEPAPNTLMETAEFFMRLVNHYKVNEELLKDFPPPAPDPSPTEKIDVGTIGENQEAAEPEALIP